MIVNPDKFKSIIIQKSNQKIKPNGSEVVEITSSVKPLEIYIDYQSNFNLHISNICKFASKQLNALIRFKCFIGFIDRKFLIGSFRLSKLNHCPVVASVFMVHIFFGFLVFIVLMAQ